VGGHDREEHLLAEAADGHGGGQQEDGALDGGQQGKKEPGGRPLSVVLGGGEAGEAGPGEDGDLSAPIGLQEGGSADEAEQEQVLAADEEQQAQAGKGDRVGRERDGVQSRREGGKPGLGRPDGGSRSIAARPVPTARRPWRRPMRRSVRPKAGRAVATTAADGLSIQRTARTKPSEIELCVGRTGGRSQASSRRGRRKRKALLYQARWVGKTSSRETGATEKKSSRRMAAAATWIGRRTERTCQKVGCAKDQAEEGRRPGGGDRMAVGKPEREGVGGGVLRQADGRLDVEVRPEAVQELVSRGHREHGVVEVGRGSEAGLMGEGDDPEDEGGDGPARGERHGRILWRVSRESGRGTGASQEGGVPSGPRRLARAPARGAPGQASTKDA
jgi:hypothetical protein